MSYILPLKNSVLTSPFGERILNNKKQFHHGTDYTSKNPNVYAVSNGIVRIAAIGYNNGAGNYIEIYDEYNRYIRYLHLKEIHVKPYENVKQGQIIGIMGNTGYSFGTHLHIDVRLQKQLGNFINFEKLLKISN